MPAEVDALTEDPGDRHVCAPAVVSGARYLFTHDRGYLGEGLRQHGEVEPPPDEQVVAMVQRLDSDPTLDAVGSAEPVTDAIKVVDAQSRVTASLDRSKLRTLGLPAVVRRTAWEAQQMGSIGLL